MLVFLNPGNEVAGIIVNTEFTKVVRQIKIGDHYLVVSIQPKSFSSFAVKL